MMANMMLIDMFSIHLTKTKTIEKFTFPSQKSPFTFTQIVVIVIVVIVVVIVIMIVVMVMMFAMMLIHFERVRDNIWKNEWRGMSGWRGWRGWRSGCFHRIDDNHS